MSYIKKAMQLYAVTDSRLAKDKTVAEQVECAVRGGVTCVQLREKDIDKETFLKKAIEIKDICSASNIPFIVNDDVEIAIKSDADGVHVGQSDMEASDVRALIGDKMILGVSVQTVEQAVKAEKAGADYLGVGAVFPTDTKKDADSVSYDTLREICEAVTIPVVAIGGINESNMKRLTGSGIDGVALVSAIFGARDIEGECRRLRCLSAKTTGTMPSALTIAGSDSSGGAGIQADIKTMTANGVYATSVITALTAQNTTGVKDILNSTPEFLASQLDCVFEDIFPDAVKIGMVSSSNLIEVMVEKLKEYKARNIVVDPVMVATSGAKLLEPEATDALVEKLIPLATLVTPNIPEAEILSSLLIKTEADMITAAKKIGDDYDVAVLLKGGHKVNDANDLLYSSGEVVRFKGKRIDNPNTHGTGCTLSSAIASNLAKGYDVKIAVERSKEYISGALGAMLDLGEGSGPMNHMFDLKSEFVR